MKTSTEILERVKENMKIPGKDGEKILLLTVIEILLDIRMIVDRIPNDVEF